MKPQYFFGYVRVLAFSFLVTGCASLQDDKTAGSNRGDLYDGDIAADMLGVADVTTANEALVKGDNHRLSGDMEKALLYFIRALELDNRSKAAASKIAKVHQQQNRWGLAESAWLTVLEIDPLDVQALEAVGLIKLEQRQYEAATIFLKNALKQYELTTADLAVDVEAGRELHTPWLAANGLGIIADLNREYTSAIESYRQALEMAPAQSLLLNNIGYSFLMAGSPGQAEAYLRQALIHQGDYALARRNLALVLTRQNKPEAAVHILTPVMGEAAALNDVGYLMMLNNDPGVAEALFRKAINSSPYYYIEAWDNLDRLKASIAQEADR